MKRIVGKGAVAKVAKDDVLTDVGPEVREMIRRYGLNQSQAAREIDVTAMTVSYWLRGHRAFPHHVKKLRRAVRRLGRRARVASHHM